MPYVITELCIRDGACAEVCPVECIVAGPEDHEEWGIGLLDRPRHLHRLRGLRAGMPDRRHLPRRRGPRRVCRGDRQEPKRSTQRAPATTRPESCQAVQRGLALDESQPSLLFLPSYSASLDSIPSG